MEVAFSGSRCSGRTGGCWEPSQQPAWREDMAGKGRASGQAVMEELAAGKHHAGPGPQRLQWPSESFWGARDQGQGPEFGSYI